MTSSPWVGIPGHETSHFKTSNTMNYLFYKQNEAYKTQH